MTYLLSETKEIYKNRGLNNTYHKDIAQYRIEDDSIDKNIRLRDRYFKCLEENPLTSRETEKKIDQFYEEYNKINPYLSEEDKAIRRQELRDDPTIDRSIQPTEIELNNNMFYQDHYDELQNILNNIDHNSREYQDIQKAETLVESFKNNYDFVYDDIEINKINLTNSDLSEDVKLQFKDGKNLNTINYQDYIKNDNKQIQPYNFEEEIEIEDKISSLEKQHESSMNKSKTMDEGRNTDLEGTNNNKSVQKFIYSDTNSKDTDLEL